jgi:hypothetical protein
MLASWAAMLAEEFESPVVVEVVTEWARREQWPPRSAAELRKFCIEERDYRARQKQRALPPPAKPEPTQAQLVEAIERQKAIEHQNLRYARGAAYRAGRLAEFDREHGITWPSNLRPVTPAETRRESLQQWAREANERGRLRQQQRLDHLPRGMPLAAGEGMAPAEKDRLRRDSLKRERHEGDEFDQWLAGRKLHGEGR